MILQISAKTTIFNREPVFILMGLQKIIQEYDFLSFLNDDMDGFGTNHIPMKHKMQYMKSI